MIKDSHGRPLTSTMIHVLQLVDRGLNPMAGAVGMSERGDRVRTIDALVRRELLSEQHLRRVAGVYYVLTEAGQAAVDKSRERPK